MNWVRGAVAEAAPDAVARRTRYRIATRLLPLLFVMYVVCFIDRMNVSFAHLRMHTEIGLSDTAYGFGVTCFTLGYILLDIPGALLVERWSARKWLARIMWTWGLFTILTGFVETPRQFYGARFLVGMAEASFFPGVIVYLTHWFTAADRAKALAAFFVGLPSATMIGALVAGALLGVHWGHLSGWRWLFILEGLPAIALGFLALRCLTDRPEQARWLMTDERHWIVQRLADEAATKASGSGSVVRAMFQRRILLLMLAWFFAMCGAQGSLYFLPLFLKRLSGLPDPMVALLTALPGLAALVGMLFNGWHADKVRERLWHTAIPLLGASAVYMLLAVGGHPPAISLLLLTLSAGLLYAAYPPLWAMPTLLLRGSLAAASVGLISSVGQLGGVVGPFAVGFLNDRTANLAAAFSFIATSFALTTITVWFACTGMPKEPSRFAAPRQHPQSTSAA
jgi:ACS family tartrate transporter-like MFS transporter